MNKNIAPLFVFLFVLSSGKLYAQEAPSKIFSQIKKLQQLWEGREQLQETLHTIDRNLAKEEWEDLSRRWEIDIKTAKRLSNLRNPFEPQLPLPESDETSEPEEVPPAREPAPPTEAPPRSSGAPPVTPPLANQYTITGLVWNTDRPQAILNGKVVDIGDQIDQWTITAISRKGVALTVRNQTFWIKPKGARHAQ